MVNEQNGKPQVVHDDMVKFDAVEQVHVDGTVDLIDARALGGASEELPLSYFLSVSFIGTVTVSQPPLEHGCLPSRCPSPAKTDD